MVINKQYLAHSNILMVVYESDLVLRNGEFLSKEWLLAHAQPELAVHLTLLGSPKVLEQALRGLLHSFFEVVCALFLLCSSDTGWQKTKLVHEKA